MIQAEHLTCIVVESNHWDRHCAGQSFVLTDLFSMVQATNTLSQELKCFLILKVQAGGTDHPVLQFLATSVL